MKKDKILTINAGSSTLKFRVFSGADKGDSQALTLLADGVVEKIGEQSSARISLKVPESKDSREKKIVLDEECEVKDHKSALEKVLQILTEKRFSTSSSDDSCSPSPILEHKDEILAIGHRVVHGGEEFTSATVINPQVFTRIRDLCRLAPLHNPASVQGINVATDLVGESIPQVAVFDTAFHCTLPQHAYVYPLPYELYEKKRVRKYGFHGTSHYYISKVAAKALGGTPEDFKLITLHLGNGCSACAIKNGKSIETSMGLTPVAGLMMGTRCGDVDPAAIFHLHDNDKKIDDPMKLEELMNRQSGFKGICGSNDVREVVEMIDKKNDERAKLAMEMFCDRVRKYIGAYWVTLGGCDVVVFSAGIGENSARIRAQVCSEELRASIGIELDNQKNEEATKAIKRSDTDAVEIQSPNSKVKVLVVATDEELEIAMQTLAAVQKDDAERPKQL